MKAKTQSLSQLPRSSAAAASAPSALFPDCSLGAKFASSLGACYALPGTEIADGGGSTVDCGRELNMHATQVPSYARSTP
eukprot:2075229-Rhodomonas_salina.1